MEKIFIELGIAIVGATALGIIASVLRQPLIIAYILTGFILGPSVFGLISGEQVVSLFSTIGIVFLLFIVGMELNWAKIKEAGRKIIIIGLLQFLITTALGYLLALLIGFSNVVSIYLGILLSFSSTVVVVKLLTEKKSLLSLHGKVVMGVLILQDLIALLFLLFLSGLGNGLHYSGLVVLGTVLNGILAVLIIFLISEIFLPNFFKYLARSSELLFLASIAWCFLISGFFVLLGFSIEMGAFLAGLAIANLSYGEEIRNKLAPLKDFFLILFFVALGMQINFASLSNLAWPLLALVLFVVFIKPLIVMITMGTMGFTKRTSFYSAISLSQVSEFSLIIAGLGFALGYLDKDTVSLIVIVTFVTILTSSYLITFLGYVFSVFEKPLRIFEKKSAKEKDEIPYFQNHIILFGFHRLGSQIFNSLKKINKKTIIVDLNPDVIENLVGRGVTCIYGDAYDAGILDKLNINKAKMVVTTFPAVKSNIFLIKKIRAVNKSVKIITMAEQIEEALSLYKTGADYVILPHYISAEHVSSLLGRIKRKKETFYKAKKKHIAILRKIKKIN